MNDERSHVGSMRKQPSVGWIAPDLIGSNFFFFFKGSPIFLLACFRPLE